MFRCLHGHGYHTFPDELGGSFLFIIAQFVPLICCIRPQDISLRYMKGAFFQFLVGCVLDFGCLFYIEIYLCVIATTFGAINVKQACNNFSEDDGGLLLFH